MKVERLYIADIEIGERSRSLDPAKVASIKTSVAEIGLKTPISVTAKEDVTDHAFRLVAGGHRLEAVRQSGDDFIDAFVMDGDELDAELWEIDENFARADLSDAQRATAHVRRQEILLEKKAINGRGGDRKSNSQTGTLKSYVKEAAAASGQGESSVHRDLARGRKIVPEVLSKVQGTDLDSGVVLDELARTPAAEQPTRLDEIRSRREAEKLNRESNRLIALTDAEQFAEWIMARTDLTELSVIISWIEGTKPKDVIAALRREAA